MSIQTIRTSDDLDTWIYANACFFKMFSDDDEQKRPDPVLKLEKLSPNAPDAEEREQTAGTQDMIQEAMARARAQKSEAETSGEKKEELDDKTDKIAGKLREFMKIEDGEERKKKLAEIVSDPAIADKVAKFIEANQGQLEELNDKGKERLEELKKELDAAKEAAKSANAEAAEAPNAPGLAPGGASSPALVIPDPAVQGGVTTSIQTEVAQPDKDGPNISSEERAALSILMGAAKMTDGPDNEPARSAAQAVQAAAAAKDGKGGASR